RHRTPGSASVCFDADRGRGHRGAGAIERLPGRRGNLRKTELVPGAWSLVGMPGCTDQYLAGGYYRRSCTARRLPPHSSRGVAVELPGFAICASLIMAAATACAFIWAVKKDYFRDIEDAKYQVF